MTYVSEAGTGEAKPMLRRLKTGMEGSLDSPDEGSFGGTGGGFSDIAGLRERGLSSRRLSSLLPPSPSSCTTGSVAPPVPPPLSALGLLATLKV